MVISVKSRSRNLANFREWRREHQCSVWHCEVELFPEEPREGEAAILRPGEKFEEFEKGAQDQKADALGLPRLPRSETK